MYFCDLIVFFEHISAGLKNHSRALSLIFSNGLWWFFLFPLLLNMGLFFSGFYFSSWLSRHFQTWFMEATGLGSSQFIYSEFLNGFLMVFLLVIVKIILFFIIAMVGGYVILVLMSPALAFLSELTEQILTGKKYPFKAGQFFRNIGRSILLSLRNFFIQSVITIFLLAAGFIPVVGLAVPVALFFVSCYFYGFSFLDYSFERRQYSVKRSLRFAAENKGLPIGSGMFFSLTMLIPFIGPFVAGFVSVVSTVAASVTAEEIT